MGCSPRREQRKRLTRFDRDVLVRELNQSIPNGWPAVLDDANRFAVAQALGLWIAHTPSSPSGRRTASHDGAPGQSTPPGWRPMSPDDELLRTLLPDEEA